MAGKKGTFARSRSRRSGARRYPVCGPASPASRHATKAWSTRPSTAAAARIASCADASAPPRGSPGRQCNDGRSAQLGDTVDAERTDVPGNEPVDLLDRGCTKEDEQEEERESADAAPDRGASPAHPNDQADRGQRADRSEQEDEGELIGLPLLVPAVPPRLEPAKIGEQGLEVELLVDAEDR